MQERTEQYRELCCISCGDPVAWTYAAAWPGNLVNAWCGVCLPPEVRLEISQLRSSPPKEPEYRWVPYTQTMRLPRTMKERWLRERGTNPPVYSPYERSPRGRITVMTDLMLVGEPSPVDGEFWWNPDGSLHYVLTEDRI